MAKAEVTDSTAAGSDSSQERRIVNGGRAGGEETRRDGNKLYGGLGTVLQMKHRSVAVWSRSRSIVRRWRKMEREIQMEQSSTRRAEMLRSILCKRE
jgi:hypothetical protein